MEPPTIRSAALLQSSFIAAQAGHSTSPLTASSFLSLSSSSSLPLGTSSCLSTVCFAPPNPPLSASACITDVSLSSASSSSSLAQAGYLAHPRPPASASSASPSAWLSLPPSQSSSAFLSTLPSLLSGYDADKLLTVSADELSLLSEDEGDGLSTSSTSSTFSGLSSISSSHRSPHSSVSTGSSPSSSLRASPTGSGSAFFTSSASSSPLRRHRRLALSAPSSSASSLAPHDDDLHSQLFRHFSLSLSLPSSHRHFLLASLLSSHPFFSILSRATRRAVWDEMSRQTFRAGAVIVRRREQCDRFFVVEAGEVSYSWSVQDDEAETRRGGAVGHTSSGGGGGKGSTFGDLCLYHPSAAHATVIAASDRVVAWSVEGSVVRHILCSAARAKHEEMTALCQELRVQLSREAANAEAGAGEAKGELTAECQEALRDRCEVIRYEEGDWLVPSPLSRDHLFVIRQGTVVTQSRSRQQQQQQRAVSQDEQAAAGVGMDSEQEEERLTVLQAGSVFAGESVLFPSTSPSSLPREPSPIPIFAQAAAGIVTSPTPSSCCSAPTRCQRRKRGRDEPASSPPFLSTIFEHDSDGTDSPPSRAVLPVRSASTFLPSSAAAVSAARKLQRRSHHAVSSTVLPPSPAFSFHRPSSSSSLSQPPLDVLQPADDPAAPGPPPCSPLRRSASSPASLAVAAGTAGDGAEGRASPFAVCGVGGCCVVAVPVDVLKQTSMEAVQRLLLRRLQSSAAASLHIP